MLFKIRGAVGALYLLGGNGERQDAGKVAMQLDLKTSIDRPKPNTFDQTADNFEGVLSGSRISN